ncbi:restriction endonuclease subunit S [Chromohalobacter israelensis]|uniref:restriction endonuclease subunit S n=1 Tax=Chromohalobacter israelensis TaxID=141390 RepID=UPI003D78D6AA
MNPGLKYGKSLPVKKRIPGNVPVYGSGGVVGTHQESLQEGPGLVIGRKGSVGSIFFESRDFFPIDTVFYVVPKEDTTELRFLYYALKLVGLEEMNSDAAVPGLNRSNALNAELYFPSVSNQKKMALRRWVWNSPPELGQDMTSTWTGGTTWTARRF